MKEGDIVYLLDTMKVVGKGKIILLDKDRLCHNVPLGVQNVLIEVMAAECDDFTCPNGDKLHESIGAFLVWKLDAIRPTTVEEECSQRSYVESNGFSKRLSVSPIASSSTGRFSSSEQPSETTSSKRNILSAIPMVEWFGEDVSAHNEEGIFVGIGSIQVLNSRDYVQGFVLGVDNIGIFFKSINPLLGVPETTWLHSIRAWKASLLFSNEGTSLKVLMDQKQSESVEKESTKRCREYNFVTRRRKILTVDNSKKKILLTDESIRDVSTKDCCSARCCQVFDRSILKLVREKHWEKSYSEKKKEMFSAIFNFHTSEKGEKMTVLHSSPICLEAWRIIHGYGKTCFNYAKHHSRSGDFSVSTSHGNNGLKRKPSECFIHMETFVKATCDEMADRHPSKLRAISESSKESKRELPTSMTWDTIRQDGNKYAKDLGIPEMSQSSFSRLRKSFSDVSIKRKGDNFSRCSICCELAERKEKRSMSSEELQRLRKDSEQHHHEHREGRRLYAAWRDESIRHPEDSLCIIHDKMDHYKTALPSWKFTPKCLDGVAKMPITVTGILTHGHGSRAIAQYNVALWPADANVTIGSLDSILRMLENPQPMIDSICNGPDTTNLFSKLLVGGRKEILQEPITNAFRKYATLDMQQKGISNKNATFGHHLPRILRLQLDNCAGDNKNRTVMAYLSMLTAKEIFEEVHLGFLMVGHTHEDVDAMFGNFSGVLKLKSAFTLLQLMKNFMTCRTPNPIPYFTQEVPDFKTFLEPFLLKGKDALMGHLKPRLFRFYVREGDKMPCMQYKMKSSSEEWMPIGGIEMWGKNMDGSASLPKGEPQRLPMMELKALDLIEMGLTKTSDFMSSIGIKMTDESQKAYFNNLGEYWKTIVGFLKGPKYEDSTGGDMKLRFGFWPTSRWIKHTLGEDLISRDLIPLDEIEYYVGPKRLQPKVAFNPRLDIQIGSFVLVRPSEDKSIYPVFLGKVLSDISQIQDHDGLIDYRCRVQWYRPFDKNARISYQARYKDCWRKDWEESNNEEIQEISIGSVVWSCKISPKKMARLRLEFQIKMLLLIIFGDVRKLKMLKCHNKVMIETVVIIIA